MWKNSRGRMWKNLIEKNEGRNKVFSPFFIGKGYKNIKKTPSSLSA